MGLWLPSVERSTMIVEVPSLRIYMHLTRDCNLRCRYCYGGEKRPERMDVDTGRRTVDFFLARAGHLILQFFGGEPLLEFPALQALVKHTEKRAAALGKTYLFELVTNGTRFDQQVADFCADHNIMYSLSFDGCAAAQNCNRIFADGSGSFNAVAANIDYLVTPLAHVVCVVNPDNFRYLLDSFRYLVGCGFTNISLSPDYTHPGLAAALPAIGKQYQALARLYLQYRQEGREVFVNIFDNVNSLYNREKCRLGQRQFSVAPNGDIYPCTAFVDHDQFWLGNVVDGFDTARQQLFWRELDQLDRHLERHHRNCPQISFCHIGCGCTNLVTTGSMSKVNPVVCQHGRLNDRVRSYVLSRLPQQERHYF